MNRNSYVYSTALLLLFLWVGGAVHGLKASPIDTLRCVDGRDSVIREAIVIRDTVYLRDTVYRERPKVLPKDIIRVKPRGRYDRGIINYRYVPKGKWIGGVTASYTEFDSDDSRLLFSLLKNFDSHARTSSIKPFVGYAVKDNVVVGAKLGYSHTIAEIDNLDFNIEDLDVSLKDLRYAEDTYSIGLFHRSYVGIDNARRFGLFNETSLTYNTGTTRFVRGKEADADPGSEERKYVNTETTLHELHIGLNPGVSVFITENVAAEMSFGVIGFKYGMEKQKNNYGETGRRRSSGANFKINLFNIHIGIIVCI